MRIIRMVEYEEIPIGPDGYTEPICKKCGNSVDFEQCQNCDEGMSYHDCGEDTCCCLDPEPNVTCDYCDGAGWWAVCYTCSSRDGGTQ